MSIRTGRYAGINKSIVLVFLQTRNLIGDLFPSLDQEIGCGVDSKSSLSIKTKLVITPPTYGSMESAGEYQKQGTINTVWCKVTSQPKST